MERPVSGRRQDAGERKKDVPDATPDQRHIRSGGLRFGRPVHQMHGTHGTQDIIFADVMLNAKNIRTKRPTKKLSHRLYGLFKVLEKRGNRAFKLDISPRWKIHPVFHVSLLEPYKVSDRPNREQPPQEPEDVKGNMEWEVEKIVKSEIITYTRKVRRVDKEFKELRYFVKWAGCSEDENTWEPPEGLVNAREIVEKFHRENPGMPGPNLVE